MYNLESADGQLPEYLRGLRRVVVDGAVLDAPMTRRVLGRLGHLPVEVRDPDRDHGEDVHEEEAHEGEATGATGSLQIGRRRAGAGHDADEAEAGQGVVYLKHYKGRFLRSCPGTRHYHCCGYRIVHIGENCPLSCSYCILQAYFQDRVLKVWANQADLFAELETAFSARPDQRWRLGTGEFTDSLTLEPLTGYSQDLVEFLGAYPQACLELKSKVVDLSWMDRVVRPDRVLPAWSMNAPEIQADQEGGSASLEERLRAALTCAQAGFRVCLHFDPVIPFPGWERGYARTVEMIADHLRPEDVAYISLGSLRFMPELKQRIEENHPQARYIYAEFITGLDGKQRLLRPLRVRQLRHVAEALRRAGFQGMYLCMESDEVWNAVFGYPPKELGGLGRYLMRRAFGE